MEDYKGIIESIHNMSLDEFNQDSNYGNMLESTLTELTFYERLIPEFFSKDGEGNNIKAIYESMREKEFTESVENIDLTVTQNLFNEYLTGMETFIGDVYATESVTEDSPIYKQILTAEEGNDKFIQSIFGGERNQKKTEAVTEAAKNFETMIDFIPVMKQLETKCSNVVNESNQPTEAINRSNKLFLEAVSNYTYNMMNSFMESYKDIDEVVFDKKEKPKTFKLL